VLDDVAISALSPPATPQAPEDVRDRAAQSILHIGFCPNDAEKIAAELQDIALLATPVTITMDEVEALTADFLGRYHKTRLLKTNVANFLKDALRRVLGDRIQISAPPAGEAS
jgi:hypothetical protein